MIKIGNIVLDDDLRLRGLEESEDIMVTSMTSFDGTVEHATMPAPDKRPLALVAFQESDVFNGHFTLAQIASIKAIIKTGLPTTLTHPRGIFNVLLTGISDYVSADDLVDPGSDDWCVATINMMEA